MMDQGFGVFRANEMMKTRRKGKRRRMKMEKRMGWRRMRRKRRM